MTYKALVVEEAPESIGHIEDALASLEHLWDVVASQEEALKRLKSNEYDYMLLASKIRARCGNSVTVTWTKRTEVTDVAHEVAQSCAVVREVEK